MDVDLAHAKTQDYDSGPTLSAKESGSGFGPNFDWSKFEQTNKLQDEVEELRQQLQEKLDENEQLSEAVLTLTKELELAEAQDQTEMAKSLAKKNKEWRDLAQKKDFEVVKLKAEIKKLTSGSAPPPSKPKPKTKHSKNKEEDEVSSLKSQVKEWKDRYKSISMSHVDYRKRLTDLKTQLSRARKVVMQEIGDEKLAREILDSKDKSSSRWRGRAQQISILQARLRDLKKIVDSGENKPKNKNKKAGMTFQDRVEAKIAQSSESRKLKNKLLEEKNNKVKADYENIKRKYDATKARNTVLEKQCKSQKERVKTMTEQMKVLISKSDNDDRLIDDLRQRLDAIAKKEADKLKEKKKSGSSEDLCAKLKEKERQLSRQCQIIAKLQTDLENEKSNAEKGFKMSVQEWDFEGKQRQMAALQSQNEKQAEILKLFNTTLQEVKQKLSESEKSRDEVSRKMEVLKKRLENRRSIKPISKDQILQLTNKVEDKERELLRLKAQRKRDVEHQQNELRLSRQLMEEQIALYKNGRNEMQKKFMEIIATLNSSS